MSNIHNVIYLKDHIKETKVEVEGIDVWAAKLAEVNTAKI